MDGLFQGVYDITIVMIMDGNEVKGDSLQENNNVVLGSGWSLYIKYFFVSKILETRAHRAHTPRAMAILPMAMRIS